MEEPVDESASLMRFKLQCFVIIGITGLIGGLLPLKMRLKDRFLSFGNTLSGGIFLAAGFTHMLAESAEGFEEWLATRNGGGETQPHGHSHGSGGFSFMNLPFAHIFCLVGILLTFFIEKVASPSGHHHSHSHGFDLEEELPDEDSHSAEDSRGILKINDHHETLSIHVYMLGLLLSVHSIIEGIALGVEDTVADATKVLIAIVAHKLFDSFAFGVNVAKKKNISTTDLFKLVSLFALTTPLGILVGMTTLHNPENTVLAATVKAVSSGTFIYIALVEVILTEFESPKDKFPKFILLLLGCSVMALLSSMH